MKLRKNMKKMVFVSAFCSCFFMAGSTVHAYDITTETESNNTKEQATVLLANRETGRDYWKGKTDGKHYGKGETTLGDEDWFKVNLQAGTNYITCQSYSFNYTIYRSDGVSVVTSGSHDGFGLVSRLRAYDFSVPSSGTYYVKIEGIYSKSEEYEFLIGTPTYAISTIRESLNTITMSRTDVNRACNLSNRSTIPDEAFVHSISVGGKAAAVENINVVNADTGREFVLRPYQWEISDIDALKVPVKSNWRITYEPFNTSAKRSKSFTSELTIQYTYPVLTTKVDL